MDAFERYKEDLADIKNNKSLIRYLRRTISQTQKNIKSLMKNPNKSATTHNTSDGPQPTNNRGLAADERRIQKDAVKRLSQVTEKEGRITRDKVTGEMKTKPDRDRAINRRSGRGGGGGSIKSPDETARGRMSLLKKKM